MKIEGQYRFPNHTDITFTDPTLIISPVVDKVDPVNMSINVHITIEMTSPAKGSWYVDINPVPVQNLNYNGDELVQRITERLNDFKI